MALIDDLLLLPWERIGPYRAEDEDGVRFEIRIPQLRDFVVTGETEAEVRAEEDGALRAYLGAFLSTGVLPPLPPLPYTPFEATGVFWSLGSTVVMGSFETQPGPGDSIEYLGTVDIGVIRLQNEFVRPETALSRTFGVFAA